MAWHLSPSTYPPAAPLKFQPCEKFCTKKHLLVPCRAVGSQEASEESSSTGPSTRTQLDLLEQLASSTARGSDYGSDDNLRRPTIREQLNELVQDREGEFSLPLGKKMKSSVKSLTISQKRNIKRQDYMNRVETRNDSRFFATIGAFVLVPPLAILSIAILTGYVQLFP